MTKVFLYEDVTATGAGGEFGSPPAPSLLAEGRAMRDAVVVDFAAVPGVRASSIGHGTHRSHGTDESHERAFRELAGRADFSLVIAPETGGRLEHLCRTVLEVGGRLLGPSPDAVHLTADKLALARHWDRHGVPTPQTWELGHEPTGLPVVLKTRDGAGSQDVGFRSPSPPASGGEGNKSAIAQEYIPGFAASVAFLIGPSTIRPLISCQQLLSADGRFQYLGGRLPIAPELAERATAIATAAIACVPGLLGYVGVDVVLGEDGRDWAIEINPRLTTSYVGLRALSRTNLAAAMLAVVRGEPVPPLDWHSGPIEFAPDGTVRPS